MKYIYAVEVSNFVALPLSPKEAFYYYLNECKLARDGDFILVINPVTQNVIAKLRPVDAVPSD